MVLIYIYIYININLNIYIQESIKDNCKASVGKMKFFVTSEVHDFNIKLFRNIVCVCVCNSQ